MDGESRRSRQPRDLVLEVAGVEAGATDDESDKDATVAAALRRTRRRALLVVLLDWTALVVLLLLADPGTAFLDPGPGERGIFTVAVLAVAVHSGFRLGQLEKLRAVERAWRSAEEAGFPAPADEPPTDS